MIKYALLEITKPIDITGYLGNRPQPGHELYDQICKSATNSTWTGRCIKPRIQLNSKYVPEFKHSDKMT